MQPNQPPRLRHIKLSVPLFLLLAGGFIATAILSAPKLNTWLNPPKARTLSELSSCPTSTSSQFKCYASYFTDKTKSSSAKAALADLQKIYDQGDSFAKSQCHQLTHQIGHEAFYKYGSLSAAYAKGGSFCWSGYYHGVTEEAVGKLGPARIKSEAPRICQGLALTELHSFNHYNCVHGLGHGFMTVENFNLFKALEACDLLNGDWEEESCYGGAFMENVMVAVREDGTSPYLHPDDLMYPCTAVQDAYKTMCYKMQTSYILQQNGQDFANAFQLCHDEADASYTDPCYESIGRDASGNTLSDVALTKAKCDLAPSADALEHCMLGAERDIISYTHSDVRAKAFCATFKAPLARRCNTDVANYYRSF